MVTYNGWCQVPYTHSWNQYAMCALTYCRLFPIRESGMNFYSQELQLHEIEVGQHCIRTRGTLLALY